MRSIVVKSIDAAELPSTPLVPGEIQWMPPGRHKITAVGGAGPVRLELNVAEPLAQRVAGQLRDYRAKAAAGTEDLPYLDFNHEDREAAGHPTEVFWGGEDAQRGGVRMKVDWTEAGAAALKGKLYRRFSPEFLVQKDTGEVLGARLNMGGLVNRAAFKTIQPIWSRAAESESEHAPALTMIQARAILESPGFKAVQTRLHRSHVRATAPVPAEWDQAAIMIGGWDSSQPKSSTNHPFLEKCVEIFDLEKTDNVLSAFNLAIEKFPDLWADYESIQQGEIGGWLMKPGGGPAGTVGAHEAEKFALLVRTSAASLKSNSRALDMVMAKYPELYHAWRAANCQPGLDLTTR